MDAGDAVIPPAVPELNQRPPKSGGVLRSIWMVLFVVPWVMLWGTLSFFAGALKCARCFRFCLGTWSRGILIAAGIRMKITRRGTLDPKIPYVFLANHQSALDIPILSVACLETHDMRFMAKESLFKVPFLGWALSWNQFIPIRRENARHSAEIFKGITESKNTIKHSYLIFPEGTRSEDGRLQPFKKGAVALILRLGFPIVPVTLIDACRANPKGTYKVRAGEIHVVFHEPIPVPENVSRATRDQLVAQVHAVIASALPEDQRPPADGKAAE